MRFNAAVNFVMERAEPGSLFRLIEVHHGVWVVVIGDVIYGWHEWN